MDCFWGFIPLNLYVISKEICKLRIQSYSCQLHRIQVNTSPTSQSWQPIKLSEWFCLLLAPCKTVQFRVYNSVMGVWAVIESQLQLQIFILTTYCPQIQATSEESWQRIIVNFIFQHSRVYCWFESNLKIWKFNLVQCYCHY